VDTNRGREVKDRKLTRRVLDAWLRSAEGGEWCWCGELKGFGALRREGGRVAFVVQFRVGRGRLAPRRRVVLGDYPTLTPEVARQRAAEHISAGWKGVDPIADARARQADQARRRDTLDALVPAFISSRRTKLRPSSAKLYESLWRRFILPDLRSKAMADVKRRDIAALMDDVEKSAGSSAADDVYEQLSIFFEWYAARDEEFTSPLIKTMKRHQKGPGARAMTDDELRQFWAACERAGIAGKAGQFCLLTATRRNEAVGLRWAEMSGNGIWMIPMGRYKTGRDHAVPLSKAAQSILNGISKASPFVFGQGERTPAGWRFWQVITDEGGPNLSGLSWHSLRKTARTLMSRAGVRADHAERALGHVQGAVERAYDKHEYLDEKRAAFEALAAEIDRIVEGQHASNVVSLVRTLATT
jgi:integrase